MRRAARIDDNQKDIVTKLRKLGMSVQSLAQLGKGVPDILVGWQGCNYLFEIKDGDKVASARKLTPDEKQWHEGWRGKVYTVKSFDEVLKIINK